VIDRYDWSSVNFAILKKVEEFPPLCITFSCYFIALIGKD